MPIATPMAMPTPILWIATPMATPTATPTARPEPILFWSFIRGLRGLVLLDDPGLVLGLVDPLGDMRVGQNRLHVDAGEIGYFDTIGDEARNDRRVHHVRRAPVAEQEFACPAPARTRLGPKLKYPVYFLPDRLAELPRGETLADVHRQLAAKVRESGMHLGRHRSSDRARGLLSGPVEGTSVPVGEEFDDRQAVPDDAVAVPQNRNLAEGRSEFVAFAPLFPFVVEQRHDIFFELLARLLDREPAAHRPARIGPVADNQLEQSTLPRRLRRRELPFVTRQCRYPFRSRS